MTNIVLTVWFVSIGLVNIYTLDSTGKEISLNSDPSEIIGTENTTILYIIIVFLSNKHLYCMFVLTPFYLVINIAMLVTVYDEI